jgi:indolepyruvate ferredoxin oxidoreductase beta subunit
MGIVNVLFSGVGGQGIILASKILAQCAFISGYRVKESELHGMAQRGGSVTSHVRFGEEVYAPLIPKGKADYLIALEELEGLRYSYFLKPNGIVVLNRKRSVPSSLNPQITPYPEDAKAKLEAMGFHVDAVNAFEIATDLGNAKMENIIIMGMLSRYLLFTIAAWEMVIKESVPPKTIDDNIAAFHKGRELVEVKI